MDARAIAHVHALGRLTLGAGLIAAPRLLAGAWVGRTADRTGGRVLAAALGARDVGIALGTLGALRAGHGADAWLRAGTFADLVDLVATVKAREHLPPLGIVGVGAMAGGAVALGAWLQHELD